MGRVAAVFNNNGAGVRGDLKAVWSAILLDDEARSPTGLTQPPSASCASRCCAWSQWARTFGVELGAGSWKIGST